MIIDALLIVLALVLVIVSPLLLLGFALAVTSFLTWSVIKIYKLLKNP